MSCWLYIAACLIAFTSIMSVWGWMMNASVPSVHAWLVVPLEQEGLWILTALVLIALAVIAYRGMNPHEPQGHVGLHPFALRGFAAGSG